MGVTQPPRLPLIRRLVALLLHCSGLHLFLLLTSVQSWRTQMSSESRYSTYSFTVSRTQTGFQARGELTTSDGNRKLHLQWRR